MMKVEIRPDWFLRDASGSALALPALLGLLLAVSELGSIQKAAAVRGMSYRHAWGILEQFSAHLNLPVSAPSHPNAAAQAIAKLQQEAWR